MIPCGACKVSLALVLVLWAENRLFGGWHTEGLFVSTVGAQDQIYDGGRLKFGQGLQFAHTTWSSHGQEG